MNIYQTIRRESAPHAANIAVIDDGRAITYAALIELVERLAAQLKACGVRRCHRVGLQCDDSLEYIALSLAVLALEAAIVPIAPEQRGAEAEEIVTRIDLEHIIFRKGLRPSEGAVELEGGEFFILHRAGAKPPPEGFCETGPAFIRFSSGTTGTSKGVVLGHRAIIERTAMAQQGLRITSGDSIVWVLSMSFHFVVTILLFLRHGATVILAGRQFPHSFIEAVGRGTVIYASPFHYRMLLGAQFAAPELMRRVRLCVCTAMKLSGDLADAFELKFGVALAEAYGIIEVGLPFIKLPGEGRRLGSVGRALEGCEVRIDKPDADGVGEIYLRGPGMLDAYYSPWQPREEVLSDGWFWTGDIGYLDGEGYLFIVGRAKDVINFAGMKVFAAEVEAVLNAHPLVRESLVYGQAHPHYGQIPVAKVVVDGEVDVLKLRRHCYSLLAQYKVPKDFEFVTGLPRTASGKLKRVFNRPEP